MRDAGRDDGLGPEATRAMPVFDRRSGPARIRYAGSAATGPMTKASGSRASGERGPGRWAGLPDDHGAADWPAVGPPAGWFGRLHPNLWVVGGSAVAAAAAMVAAFAAASGAIATGYSPVPRPTAAHAPVSVAPARPALGATPAGGAIPGRGAISGRGTTRGTGSIWVSPASPVAGR